MQTLTGQSAESKQQVAKIREGDARTFETVYNRYADKIYWTARRLHIDHEDARGIVQQVFLSLWESRRKLDENLSLNAYLLTLTKNRVINHHKHQAVILAYAGDYRHSHSPTYYATEDEVLYADLEQKAFSFIDQLPPRRKQIFLLSHQEDLNNDEIARLLCLSKRTVENNLYQAEQAIRRFLAKNKLPEKILYLLLFWSGL